MHALRALHRLSLVDHTPDAPYQTVRVHQLVQRAARDALTPLQHDQIARTAADALVSTWPKVERDTDLAQALRANTAALMKNAEDALFRPHAHAVLYRVGTSLGQAGQVAAARDHYQYGRSGEAAAAAADLAALLEHKERVLGPEHPHTLATRRMLAFWRSRTGEERRASGD